MPDVGPLITRRGSWGEFPATVRQVLGAQYEETGARSPIPSLRLLSEESNIELGELIDQGDPMLGIPETRAPVKRLSADEVRRRLADSGIPLGVKFQVPNEGMPEGLFDLKVRETRAQMQRDDIFSRGPQTWGMAGARLGTALARALQDPLNIASGFILWSALPATPRCYREQGHWQGRVSVRV